MKNVVKTIVCLLCGCLFLYAGSAFPQITVTSPSNQDNVKACADYADEVLLDRWDMDKRTDMGWRIFNTVEQPISYLSNITFQNGIFSATSTSNDPKVTLLDSGYPGSAMLGKIGTNFPINASKYQRLVVRMYLDIGSTQPWGQLIWSKNTIYPGSGGGITTSQAFFVHDGWIFYFVDIPSLGIAPGSPEQDPWNGLIDSLRLDPIATSGKQIKIDWVRLVEYDGACQRQITWSGSNNVDIYLDNNNNSSDGHLGRLAQGVSGNSYSFLAGGLAPGNYYVVITPAGGNPASGAYSSGYYHVNDVPIVRLTSPSAEGSSTDFITVNFSDPWDMANTEDVDYTVNLQNETWPNISYQDMSGTSYSNQSVFRAENNNGNDDPRVFFMHFLWRGKDHYIDTSKYHNLVFKMGIWGTQSVNDGSIARVIWRNKDETGENVGQDIIIRHLPGTWIMNKIVCDMDTLPLDNGPSQSGWNGELDCFRIDPHEFTGSRQFFFDDIKLTTDCQANTSYTIEWNLSDSDDTPSLSLYRDNNNSGYNGSLIVSGLTPSPGNGSYQWDTSSVPQGKYWIYAVVNDGTNSNRCYTTGPVVIDHSPTLIPGITLSKTSLNFGAERNGPVTSAEEILITNSGQGILDWQATANRAWIDVSPASGSGDGYFTISVDHSGLGTGTYSGSVRVEDPNAGNSPQFIDVSLTVYGIGSDSPPFGVFDTPPNGATVSGNIPVSGWALDDIDISKVTLRRSSHPNDPPGAIGPDGLVYIDKALFIKGARPDVQAAYPNYPKSDKAGWGCMMLTNFLPNGGNGTFTIYVMAYDVTGHTVELGHKTIICDNANRVAPFGTLDTPTRGGVISGTDFANFGWALTPQPKIIPIDGSTIWVYVDGVPLGNPVYNQYRVDIATRFPGYRNSDGAVGYFMLDTTQFANGIHNIAWSVTDDQGAVDGIGARYFEIQNLGGGGASQSSLNTQNLIEDSSGMLTIKVDVEEVGYRLKSRAGKIQSLMNENKLQNPKRDRYPHEPLEIEVEELERIVLRLETKGGQQMIGWGNHASQDLPIGSYFDQSQGKFYWVPGPGFLGRHVLHFATSDGTFRGDPVEVVINIVPRKYTRPLQ